MAINGWILPTNKTVSRGEFALQEMISEGEVTAGQWLSAGTAVGKCKAGDPGEPAIGFACYEESYVAKGSLTDFNQVQRPRGLRLPFATGSKIAILFEGGFDLPIPTAAYVTQETGDALAGWTDGTVLPGKPCAGGVTVKIPFTKSTSELSTGFVIPAGIKISDARVRVTTGVADATIDVGILSTEAGGDADGILDGVSCATAGIVQPIISDTTVTDLTKGALISTVLKSNDTTPVFFALPTGFIGDGTAKTVSYTTSNHAITGFIELDITGVEIIAKAEYPLAKAATTQWAVARSLL